MTPREYVKSLKEGRGCADCGVSYPHYVMQFDHVRGEKVANLSKLAGLVGEWAFAVIDVEARKCDLVCANCHAERTWRRRHEPRQKAEAVEIPEVGMGERVCEGCGARYRMNRQRKLYGPEFDPRKRCSPGCAPGLWTTPAV